MTNDMTTDILYEGLGQLGLDSEINKLLYFVKDKASYSNNAAIWFQLERAELYKANAVFLKQGVREGEYFPQIYIYDETDKPLAENTTITQIHKNVWTGGDVPLVCIFTKTEIKILDTTRPITKTQERGFTPTYLIENLKTVATAQDVFNQSFVQKLKSGTYWDSSNVNFDKNSSYSKLTALLRRVIDNFTQKSGLEDNKEIVQKLIIQCILIKYLEERRDDTNNTVFPACFFNKYQNASQFSDVLNNGSVFAFFDDLNQGHFNGGIFDWADEQKDLFKGKQSAFDYLGEVLRGYTDIDGQNIIAFEDDNFSRLYSFNHIPVELISRLYEEFIIKENQKKSKDRSKDNGQTAKNDGVAYTPSHLVRLLVNESMPLSEVPDNITDFKVLDPACGSAIFLVVAFQRLVQWWRQKNDYRKPDLSILVQLLNSVYGVDVDAKAVQISVFSLCIALCDELSPKAIWDNLKFDNLEGKNIFCENFFRWKKRWLNEDGEQETERKFKFDVVIGNPPFIRGELTKEQRIWKIIDDSEIEIPQGQIALKFVSESLGLLKPNGLSCLIVKSLPLLYSNSDISKDYMRALVCNYCVEQILDFTPLARNKSLWDGSGKAADVSVAAIFISMSRPDVNRNILHAIFRRTKANKERIYFEIDKYDLHYVLRDDIYKKDSFVFKINLLGGGRLRDIICRLRSYPLLKEYERKNICVIREGHGTLLKKAHKAPSVSERMKSTGGIIDGIVVTSENISDEEREKIPDSPVYYAPTLLIGETINLNDKSIVMALTDRNLIFKNRFVGIRSLDNSRFSLNNILGVVRENERLYIAYLLSISAQVYVNLNTSIYCEDLKELPILANDFRLKLWEKNVIEDILTFTDDFIRHENSSATNPISGGDIESEMILFGEEFSATMNELYADDINSFKLTDVINFERENLIGVLFSYDDMKAEAPRFSSEVDVSKIGGLINFDINESLTATRIIQYYAPNKVLFVKPNQKRYWLASIAYRDADSVFADILNTQWHVD